MVFVVRLVTVDLPASVIGSQLVESAAGSVDLTLEAVLQRYDCQFVGLYTIAPVA